MSYAFASRVRIDVEAGELHEAQREMERVFESLDRGGVIGRDTEGQFREEVYESKVRDSGAIYWVGRRVVSFEQSGPSEWRVEMTGVGPARFSGEVAPPREFGVYVGTEDGLSGTLVGAAEGMSVGEVAETAARKLYVRAGKIEREGGPGLVPPCLFTFKLGPLFVNPLYESFILRNATSVKSRAVVVETPALLWSELDGFVNESMLEENVTAVGMVHDPPINTTGSLT